MNDEKQNKTILLEGYTVRQVERIQECNYGVYFETVNAFEVALKGEFDQAYRTLDQAQSRIEKGKTRYSEGCWSEFESWLGKARTSIQGLEKKLNEEDNEI